MIFAFRLMIIFALFIWHPYGLGIKFRVGNKNFACRAVTRSGLRIQIDVSIQKTESTCAVIANIGDSGSMYEGTLCVLSLLHSTRHYVHLTSGYCQIGRKNVSFSGDELRCVLQHNGKNKPRALSEGTRRKFGKNGKKYLHSNDIVFFINSTKLIRNAILKWNVSNTRSAKCRTSAWKAYGRRCVFICFELNGSVEREKLERELPNNERFIHGEALERARRHILGHYNHSTVAFSPYFTRTTMTTSLVTTTLRSYTDVQNPCPRSVVVNCSTIFVTPTFVTIPAIARLVATSHLTPVTWLTSTAALRNHSFPAKTSIFENISTLTLNGTPQATYIHNHGLVSAIYTSDGSAFVTSLGCATVVTTTQNFAPTNTTEKDDDDSKNAKLYFGLIVGGGVVLALVIFVALFLLARRYRRIQALRRKAKQISYFNKFDCSSAWDEPDKFGGSKLSVFTLKNSKFDIDLESTHDTKQ